MVVVFSGSFFDGLEFVFSDGQSALFGGRGGRRDEVRIDANAGERLLGFIVRSGFWIDGMAIRTTHKQTQHFGSMGGGLRELMAPQGYNIAGVFGSSAAWADSFGILYTNA